MLATKANWNNMSSKYLFPVHVLHAMNAIQYLRAMYILSEPHDSKIWSTVSDIAKDTGAPKDSLMRSMPILVRMGLVTTHKGANGGYQIVPYALLSMQVIDILDALGMTIQTEGNSRGSDRLNLVVSECLRVNLEQFFK